MAIPSHSLTVSRERFSPSRRKAVRRRRAHIGIMASWISLGSLEEGETRHITHDLLRYDEIRASADAKTLQALQHQILNTIQVGTAGRESEAQPLSTGNQSNDGVNGVAWTMDAKIVYNSHPNGNWDVWEMGSDPHPPHHQRRIPG